LPLGTATTYGFSFNTADIGSPGSVDVCLTHSGFGTPGTDIVAHVGGFSMIKPLYAGAIVHVVIP